MSNNVIFGKLNRKIIPLEYTGVDTETANITVDNENKTIKVDVLETGKTYTAGANIQISPDNVISATDTTYSNLPASQGGTDVSLVTTGDKYLWNSKQEALVSGTNIKTINNTSVLGSGNIDTKELFYCTFETTTYSEITTALSNGKIPVCKVGDKLYYFSNIIGTDYYFSYNVSDNLATIRCNNQDIWATIANFSAENTGNRVTSLSASSTNAQYPSAKCVYDFVGNNKEIFYCTYGTTTYAEITQALSDGKTPVCFYNNNEYIYVGLSNTNRYTFASQLFDTNRYISVNNSNSWGGGSTNFEITTNKVTSISSSSTDTQYPSAKCVYDNFQNTIDATNDTSLLPTSANTTGIMKFVIAHEADVALKYNGYMYLLI